MGYEHGARSEHAEQNARESQSCWRDENEIVMEKTNFAEQSDMQTQIKAINGMLYVARVQDVEPYIKQNDALRNSVSDYKNKWSRKDRPLRFVADIPNIVAEQWLKEGVNVFSSDPDMVNKVRKKLDEYKRLKTHPGRLGVRRSQRF